MNAAKPTIRQFSLAQSSYCVHSFGQGEPAMLALHGFTGSGLDFAPLAHALGTAVHCPDLPGHGGTRGCSGIEAAADDQVKLCRELGADSPVLLGYSMGGRTALTLSCRHRGFARALVLVGASAGLADPEEREARRLADEQLAGQLEADGTSAFIDRWQQLPLLQSQQRMDPLQWQAFSARRRAADPAGLASSLRTMGTGSMPSLWDRLSEVQIPTLLVTGEEDARYTEIAQEMATRMTAAQCSVVAGAGHSPHLERPAAVAELVQEFLASLG